jgi:hypothetical protein
VEHAARHHRQGLAGLRRRQALHRTENTGNAGGKFFIIRPHADRGEILDEDWLGTPEESELIIASPIVARGRVYVVDGRRALRDRAEGGARDGSRRRGPAAAPRRAAARPARWRRWSSPRPST